MLSRILPGSVVVVAALTLPELSVGAGDFGGIADGSGERSDPPRPMPIKDNPVARLASAPVKSVLTGVRYAPIIDLGPEFDPDPVPEAASPAPLAAPRVSLAEPADQSARVVELPAPSLPESETGEAAFAAGVGSPMPGLGAELAVAETMPRPSDPIPVPPAEIAAELVQAVPVALTASAGLAEEAALPPPAAQVIAASVAAAPQAGPPGRGLVEQLAPPQAPPVASPAAVAAVPPASRPAQPAPVKLAAAPVAPKAPVAAAAPGTRAPAQVPVAAAKPAAPAAPPPAAAVVVPAPKPALAAPASAASSRYPVDIKSQLITRVDGKTAGAVDFQQTPAGLTVRLGSIVEVLADRYDAAQLARIRGSAAGNTYVSLSDLQAQGIPISYDPVYDEFNVGLTDTRPKAARKVHMDQISAPERGLGSTGMEQVRR